ncbi:hypothetical protein AAVH_32124 [Aphelenchoides avenae]|nr:hypothetical protein AAVH_32124 [Aphelenchus avenae]
MAGHVAAVPRHSSFLPGWHKTRTPPKPSIPGFPISRKGPKSHLPSVKNLCIVGSAVSDVVEISTDNTAEIKCSVSELARVLNGYNAVEKLELKGIHFETYMADAFSLVDKTLWSDCELVVRDCDFRALSADACATLLGQFTSKNIHLVGAVELPESCQDLLELPTFKAAYCLKFSRNESGTTPAAKIDTEKLAEWLHSGGEVPRYVMLQSQQISNLNDAIATFLKEHHQTKATSQYLVDIYTDGCPMEKHKRVIQKLEPASRQRINIRYDSCNNRMILKRFSEDRIDAKSFELQIRTFAGVRVPDYRGRGRVVAPKKTYQMPEYAGAIERPQRRSLNDVSVMAEQASGGHSAASIVPMAERALSVAWATQHADQKREFVGCVSYYSGRVFDMLLAKGQGQATVQFKQRLLDLFAEMERSVGPE